MSKNIIKIRKKKKADGYCRVRDFKVLLEGMDDDRVIILAKDSEGDNYSPLDRDDIWSCKYEPYSPNLIYNGECGHEILTPDMIKDGYDEDDILERGEKCIVLFPMN